MYDRSFSKSNTFLQSGFTVVELLIVIAISSVLIIPSIVSYVSYNNTQVFNNAVLDVKTELQLAQSRAQTQTKPTSNSCNAANPLVGYQFRICCTTAGCPACQAGNNYEVDAVCGTNAPYNYVYINGNVFPNANISIKNASSPYFFQFNVLDGSVTNSGSFDIMLGAAKKTTTITSTGVIQIQ